MPEKSPDGGLMYLLPMEYRPIMDYIGDMYQGSTIEDFRNKYNGAPVFFYFAIPARTIRGGGGDMPKHGVNAAYYDGHGCTGASLNELMPFVILTGLDNPGFNMASAMWSARLDIPVSGEYGFDLRSHGYSSIIVDGRTVIFNPSRPGSCELLVNRGDIYLKKGMHSLKIKYETNDTPAYMQGCTGMWMFWKKPGDMGESSIPGTLLFPE
jgi:hypothetical protein